VEPLPAAPPPDESPAPELTTTVTDADLDYIAARNLLIPVANMTARQLRDTFSQARSEGREHGAIDIMAPQWTPVLATTDGVVIKLFHSDRGGVTLYELDPSGRYVYYYAHLMRYAEGIAEGKQLRRGDVIGYVGDTGNAGAGQYHLHFGISKLTSPRQWSGGVPINPFPLLVGK
jgi:peptidoglycan LD-endopeptidase LytH